MYLTDGSGVPEDLKRASLQLSTAGTLGAIALLRVYRASLRDRDEIDENRLSAELLNKKIFLQRANFAILFLGFGVGAAYMVACFSPALIPNVHAFWLGLALAAFALAREWVSIMRASGEFIIYTVQKPAAF